MAKEKKKWSKKRKIITFSILGVILLGVGGALLYKTVVPPYAFAEQYEKTMYEYACKVKEKATTTTDASEIRSGYSGTVYTISTAVDNKELAADISDGWASTSKNWNAVESGVSTMELHVYFDDTWGRRDSPITYFSLVVKGLKFVYEKETSMDNGKTGYFYTAINFFNGSHKDWSINDGGSYYDYKPDYEKLGYDQIYSFGGGYPYIDTENYLTNGDIKLFDSTDTYATSENYIKGDISYVRAIQLLKNILSLADEYLFTGILEMPLSEWEL